MLIALIVSLNALAVVAVLFWLSARRVVSQSARIVFLESAKHKFDTLTGFIQNTITNGGWLTIAHNGNMIPFGPLLDKMEPVSDKVQ